MRKALTIEFVYQVFALLLAVILVHAAYVSVIRPRAEAVLAENKALLAADKDAELKRSGYVILRDYEQEACFILMFWAFAIMAYKGVAAMRERRLLDEELISLAEGVRVLPEDAPRLSRQLAVLPQASQSLLLPRALTVALHRFEATRSIQDVSTATHAVCVAEAERLDAELAMIRYIAWAIPSIGFIGTVRGIGEALGLAHKAVEGDITGVTENLGIAFNSTLTALLISIVLMFVVHQLQLAQERLVLETENYCDEHLIRRLWTG